MDNIFCFDDILNVQDHVIKNILYKTNTDDLTKALIREDKKIRKLFYRNMDLKTLKLLDKKLLTMREFTSFEKKEAQRRILKIVADLPDYSDFRFEIGFSDINEFEDYLLGRHQPEKAYGILNKDITRCRFFESKNGENFLEDIRQKNEAENMGNYKIPNTNIQLINYSICPKCNHLYSFKDISDYYLNPLPDPLFNNKKEQFREDTRMFCDECKSYFLPALIIIDGTPKSEVQFLCRIQTMNSIEVYFREKGIAVLSKDDKNLIKKDAIKIESNFQEIKPTFFDRMLGREGGIKRIDKNVRYKKIAGIKNDVMLTDMTEKPTLISNLILYTPTNIVLNLIDGSNIRKGDLLFGSLDY